MESGALPVRLSLGRFFFYYLAVTMDNSQSQSQEAWKQAALDCCEKGQWIRVVSPVLCPRWGLSQ